MINILYNDLKTLIIDSELVPEEQYRITDYVTTVSKANYTSAGYKFDIVVTALTTNTLYEYATLMANATETYFDVDALSLYNIKYNVYNVIPGYYNDWVDANGKGCIYYMADDKGNEAPFDFKNIKYNGKFLFNNTLDGSDTSQTVSTYNSVKEVIDDDTFNIPQVSFNNECNDVSIDISVSQVSIYTCSKLQIGKSCSNSIFATVNNVVIGNDFINGDLNIIDGGEIGNNNNGITATNQTNLIIKDNNTTITLGGGSNGVIIDSNNTNVTIGTNAKDVYINGSKTIDLGNNTEQFNISSCYDVVVVDDCKLFTLNQTNHLTSTSGCQSINAISNDYVTLTEAVTNVTVSEGLTNLILDGSILSSTDAKNIIQQDEKVVVINEQTNAEVVLVEDGTTTSNPNSYITDSPSDNKTYGRKNGNWSEITTSGGISIISITYTELKDLRDRGQLVPGQSYKIIDYMCTTVTVNSRSASNQFDIIVTALDENTLSENASATYHEGDTYFSNSRLESWELKYCLDNDIDKFDWADIANGKGVIYYMKDNYNNELPYDFKNIQYLKNSVWVYTFGGATDNSLIGGCYNNKINLYILVNTNKQTLNFNTFGNDCSLNTFGDGCNSNTFGDGCYLNTFGYYAHNNTFGNDCDSNIFGNYFNSNTFGSDCGSNTFGDYCSSNKFGDDCNSNKFGYFCYSNTFGDWCESNVFGDRCESNTFGDYCDLNTFGNECIVNKFYDGVSGTIPKNYIRYITLEDGVRRNNFYSNVITSNDVYLQRIRIKGLENTTPTDTIITLPATNTDYNWVIAKNSSNIVEQYCPENLVDAGISDAPVDNKIYGRKDGDWEQIVTNGISDAPINGTPYSRQDGDWVVAETGIEDAPNDGEVYGRKNSLWEVITTSGGINIISITWLELKNLRDNAQLVPGQSYRITDYVCTTVTTDTRSAGNQFDIIVTALDEGVLSENASATYHESDTYFTNAKLESWELKYCLDNDTNRFAWADNVNGKGVIYYMKDNRNNELPYDFKNIQYLKNSVWVYTFGGDTDNSLSVGCFNNKINSYITSNKQTLNNITFGTNCHSNTFGDKCYSNTFGKNCYVNTFGSECYSNTFGSWLSGNTFGNGCYSNTFGLNCSSNTFGNGCRSNTFGDWYDSNTFGNGCRSNNFYDGSSGTTPNNYIGWIVLEDGVRNNNFYSNLNTDTNNWLQRIRIKGLENTTATNTTIALSTTNTKYEWIIARNSAGVVKQYCLEDLIP